MSVRADVGSSAPCAKLFWPSRPRWAGRGRAHSACLSGPRVQISKKEGCGAAAPTSPPPQKNRQQKQGWRQRHIASAIMHGESGTWAGGRRLD